MRLPEPVEILEVDPQAPAIEILERALAVLKSRGLLIYPTDTLYAIGGLALEEAVSKAVRRAKGRPDDKPLPVIVGSAEHARDLTAAWPAAASILAARFWPGPLSLVVPARAGLPPTLLGGGTSLALRVPGSELARRLALEGGPLISTSANRAGDDPPTTCAQAVSDIGLGAALALDGGPGQARPSTIVDLTAVAPRLLRPGMVPWEDVQAALD